jgi:hypothetical protein
MTRGWQVSPTRAFGEVPRAGTRVPRCTKRVPLVVHIPTSATSTQQRERTALTGYRQLVEAIVHKTEPEVEEVERIGGFMEQSGEHDRYILT